MRLHPKGFELFQPHSPIKKEIEVPGLIIAHDQHLTPEDIARQKLDRHNPLFKKSALTTALHGLGELLGIK